MVSGYIRKPRVFNPRLREGGDPLKLIASCASLFSIHASAKEATEFDSFLGVLQKFSIHASAKEATEVG